MKLKDYYFWTGFIEICIVLTFIALGLFYCSLEIATEFCMLMWWFTLVIWLSTRMGELINLRYKKQMVGIE